MSALSSKMTLRIKGMSARLLWLVAAMLVLSAAPVKSSTDQTLVIDTQQVTDLSDLVNRLAEQRLVYVGETHTSVSDHRVQLAIARGLVEQGKPLALGVEWFARSFQSALDDYIAQRIDEAQMLRATEYFSRWGFDYRLYRPIMQFAREQGIPVIALNARRELTDQVMRQGLEGLSPSERAALPEEYDFAQSGYEELLRSIYGQHAHRDSSDEEMFGRFHQVQLTWDETMAETVARYLQGNPDSRMLVLAGTGHVHASAIPPRVQRRVAVQSKSVVSYQAGGPFNRADYLVLQADEALPPAGLIGVALEDTPEGVKITGFASGEAAKDAGVRLHDLLLAVDDQPVTDYTDVKVRLLGRSPGDLVRLSLQREGLFGGDTSIEVELPLQAPGQIH